MPHSDLETVFSEALVALAAIVFQIVARSSNGYSDARNQSFLLSAGGASGARSWRDIDAGEDEEKVF
jgi:hypothetical protein